MKKIMNKTENFKTIITAEHHLLDLHLRETFQYRDLIFMFVKRDFTSVYKQTILGPLWAIIQPLLTTVVFTVIFGNLAKLTTADIPGEFAIPGFLFYMAGNICWGYFSSTLQATSNTFLINRATMSKVYYPRLVSPIATAFSKLISFGIQLVMFLVIWVIYYMKGEVSIRTCGAGIPDRKCPVPQQSPCGSRTFTDHGCSFFLRLCRIDGKRHSAGFW